MGLVSPRTGRTYPRRLRHRRLGLKALHHRRHPHSIQLSWWKAAKATYTNPSQSENVKLGMVGFVDDSNGQTNLLDQHESEITWQRIIAELKNNAQLWAERFGLTGGALELSKCSYQPCHDVAMHDRSTNARHRLIRINCQRSRIREDPQD